MLKVVHSKQSSPAVNPGADEVMPSFTWAELEEAMLTIAAGLAMRSFE